MTEVGIPAKPLKAIIGGETEVTLTEAAKDALRDSGLHELRQQRKAIEEAFAGFANPNGPETRYELEDIADALNAAGKTVDVLWWLAPEHGDIPEDAV